MVQTPRAITTHAIPTLYPYEWEIRLQQHHDNHYRSYLYHRQPHWSSHLRQVQYYLRSLRQDPMQYVGIPWSPETHLWYPREALLAPHNSPHDQPTPARALATTTWRPEAKPNPCPFCNFIHPPEDD